MIINNNNNNGDCDYTGNCTGEQQPSQVVPQAVKKTNWFDLLLTSNGVRNRGDFVRIALNIGYGGFHWFYIGFKILGIIQIITLLCCAYSIANYIHMLCNDGIWHMCHTFWLCRFEYAETALLFLFFPYILLLLASYVYAIYWLFGTDEKFNEKFGKK